MRAKAKICAVVVTASLACLFMLLPTASGAGSITLTPTAQAPGASVSVAGTGFGATKAVGIGFGGEVQVMGEVMSTYGPYGVSGGPYYGNTAYLPVKPGTFKMALELAPGGASMDLFSDVAGNGTLYSPLSLVVNATIDYATGRFTSFWTGAVDAQNQALPHIVEYTRYQYNVTPAVGVNTSASGAFTANIAVPNVANGNYAVTAIDTQGNIASATVNVNSTIPEVLPIGAVLLLSSVAVIASSWHFRKRPRIAN